MPVVRAGKKLIYFAHVPKCGGDSVEHYLERRFGKLAFVDRQFLDRPAQENWSRTSPQHVTAAHLAHLFPRGFFDASFAVVRHPVLRAVSAYQYDIRLRCPDPPPGFSEWLEQSLAEAEADPFARDNHMRPQVAFLPDKGTRLFRLEDGLAAVVAWLDEITESTGRPRSISHHNRGPVPASTVVASLVTPKDLDIIAQFYSADFRRLGYIPDMPQAGGQPSGARQRIDKLWRRIIAGGPR